MKKLFAILVACFFLMASSAMATLTSIQSPPAGELSIDSILITLYGSDNYLRIDDDFDKIWMNLDGGAIAKARYAADNHGFGYIDGDDDYQQLFEVSGSSGFINGGVYNMSEDKNVLPTFKWALDDLTTGCSYTSDPSDNNVIDHMVTWLITGGDSQGNYVIAWEDRYNLDWDFNDLVVEISKAAPVPEPASLLLLASGLAGLAILKKRFRKN